MFNYTALVVAMVGWSSSTKKKSHDSRVFNFLKVELGIELLLRFPSEVADSVASFTPLEHLGSWDFLGTGNSLLAIAFVISEKRKQIARMNIVLQIF